MSDDSQPCPKCNSPYGYPDQNLWVCPECFHEWTLEIKSEDSTEEEQQFIDANGNVLQDGDTVKAIRDLSMGKETIKSGTKIKNIKLLDEPVNDHDISCKIAGHGQVYLKCSVVKKVK